MSIAPIVKSVTVKNSPLRAFELFTGNMGKWWPAKSDIVSLTDITITPQIDMFVGLPEWEPLTGAHSQLRSWLATMNARPSMQATTWDKVAELAK